jgi:hypothetical protein
MGIFKLPGRAYDYVYASYGWWGVAFGALGLVLLIVSIMIYFDRRR